MVANVEYLGLNGAARRFRIDGKSVHASTVFRWMKDGIVSNGNRVQLGYVRMGRRLATTQAFINKFTRELAEADSMPRPGPEPCIEPTIQTGKRTESQRQTALAKNERELRAAGM